ncbi:MAG: PepSY domain-containing protein [Xanthomonadales bacterium]|nr:PepSY domain-containing protein [Xanthomonadales bacterium]
MYKKFMTCVLSLPIGLTATALSAQSVGSRITLDQAVQRVQAETDGKVLSAEPRRSGRREEYRIKVLTPAGHVRVIVVSSEAGKPSPAAAQSARRSPGRRTEG